MTMKPPPPGPATNGTLTPIALPVATAASIALPPRFRTSIPACVAYRSIEATAPPVPTDTADEVRAAAAGAIATSRTRTTAARSDLRRSMTASLGDLDD